MKERGGRGRLQGFCLFVHLGSWRNGVPVIEVGKALGLAGSM